MEQDRIEKLIEEMLGKYPRDQVINALNSLAYLPKENFESFVELSRKIDEKNTHQ
ncbi:hypothetical protein [Psychrobacillus glaciei]|uniref:hypothetical protein n=1 Tax=Psychrobacillus glaciei TaxID=2283160 RepID=UPI00178C6626|nr:hypothetical protein [Psychrobacillus glaciei]